MVNPGTDSEAALIERAQQGDRAAYGELVRSHYPGVIQVIYRMCGDSELAQDAAQDAFIRAWSHLSTFRPGSSMRNWLYRIAVNAALDSLRKQRRTVEADLETLPIADPQDGPEDNLLQRERTTLVRRAILSLSEASRAALVLREYGGLSYDEIAATLDIPLGTVMSRLSFARKQLKEALRAHMHELELEHD